MRFVDDKICFVNVDVDYMCELHRISNEVQYAERYNGKPFVGVLIQNDGLKYVIPLSSAKEKHKGWKNESQDCFLVYEIVDRSVMSNRDIYISTNNSESSNQVKHILSVLDLKKMIPVTDNLYRPVYVNILDSDTEDMKKYKKLLEKELQFCIRIKNKILDKAERIYLKQKKKRNIRFCVDFFAVEEVCRNYNVIDVRNE